MKRLVVLLVTVMAGAMALNAQSLTNGSLAGRYYVHHVIRQMSNATTVTDQRSISGALQFDGTGGYSFVGTRKIGADGAAVLSSTGTYSVNSIGVVRLSNLQGAGPEVNARYSALAVVGASTEAGGGLYDLFVAIPAPAVPVVSTLYDGAYRAASLEFDAVSSRATFFTMSIESLAIGASAMTGIATNFPPGLQVSTFPTSPLSIGSDARGQTLIPGNGLTALYFGNKAVYGSRDGNIVLLVPEANGTHGLTIGVRVVTPASNTTFSGLYWSASMRQNGARPGSFVGTVNSVGNGVSLVSGRAREVEGVTDFTGRSDYQITAAGTGTNLTRRMALGAAGDVFVATGASEQDPNNYELSFGVRVPPVTVVAGPFLNPYGAVNTASFAPTPNPIAPGQYLDLYGASLATGTVTATAPFPVTLGGVQVLVNDRPAPIYIVTPGLVKVLVPYATPVGAATVTAIVNGVRSNTIPIVVARTAPGVFSARQNGIDLGAILRVNNTIMTALNPARRGETIQIFLNGLGAVTPAVPDGAVSLLTVLNTVNASVRVYIRGVPAEVSFKGLAPGIVSLYQLNVTVPSSIPGGTWPLAIETDDAFSDQVDVVVAP